MARWPVEPGPFFIYTPRVADCKAVMQRERPGRVQRFFFAGYNKEDSTRHGSETPCLGDLSNRINDLLNSFLVPSSKIDVFYVFEFFRDRTSLSQKDRNDPQSVRQSQL